LIFGYIFLGLSIIAAILQEALALGAPPGELILVGKFPGNLSPKIRITALYEIAEIGIEVAFAFIMGSTFNFSSPGNKEIHVKKMKGHYFD